MSVDIINGRSPTANVITGGQPSEAQFSAFRATAQGPCRVINLRGGGEPGVMAQAALMAHLGIDYVHLPVSGPADVSFEAATALSSALEYDGPVLVHCASGNRVGALRALGAFQHEEGCDVAKALVIGRQWGLTRMEPMVAGILRTAEQARPS